MYEASGDMPTELIVLSENKASIVGRYFSSADIDNDAAKATVTNMDLM